MEQGSVFSSRDSLTAGLTGEALKLRLQQRRGTELRSDIAIARSLGATDLGRPAGSASHRPAAVLVPLVMRPEGQTVLLTKRTAHLNHHAGQIAFPGGRVEDLDADAVACALRETEEETGLKSDHIDVLGTLDDYVTVTGFRVVPVVGLVRPPFDLSPDPFEVAEVFEVPLDYILDPANHQKVPRKINGQLRPYYAISYQTHYIWGATAGMLMNLCHVLEGA